MQENMEAPKRKKNGAGLLVLLGVGLAALLLGTKKAGPGPGPGPSPLYTAFLSTINLVTTLEQLEAVKAGIEDAYTKGLLTLAEYQALLDAYLAKKAALPGPGPNPTFDSLLAAINAVTTLEQLEAVKAGIEDAYTKGLLTLTEYQTLVTAYLAKKAALTGGNGTTPPPPPTGPLLNAGALVVT